MYTTWNRLSARIFLIDYIFPYNCSGKQTKTQNRSKMQVLMQTAYLGVVLHTKKKKGKQNFQLNESEGKKKHHREFKNDKLLWR